MTFSPEGGVTKVPAPAVRPNACAIVGETTKSRRLVGVWTGMEARFHHALTGAPGTVPPWRPGTDKTHDFTVTSSPVILSRQPAVVPKGSEVGRGTWATMS